MRIMVENKGKILSLIFMTVIIIFITLFGMSEIKAYYQKELNVNIPFTTASYSALTLSLDKTSYPSGNNTSTVLLTVTNPNSYAVSYTLSFSNTNATYQIDGSAGATYVVTGNSNKTNTIAINGATGTSITITVNTVLPYSASTTTIASFDNVNPTVEVTTTNNVAASQTATLKCSDTVGVTAYYWGTTEPTSVSNITTTTTADLNSLKSTNGLAKTVSGAGTYWLGCRDAAGNFSKTSIVYRKVTLSMSNGTVSPTSIVAKSGNSVALPTPTANNGYTNAGYWYSSNAYSTSVGAYGSNYTVSSTTTIYSRATDVTAPTVSFNPNTSSSYAKTASVTVTVADAGSKVKANQTIKYRWQTSSTCSTTASDYTSSATLSNTSAASTTATVPASGLTGTHYLCIYSGIQDVAGNNSVITKSGSFLFDNTAPSSCSWGNWSTSYIKSGGTATITLTCADANSGITMDLTTSDVTVSGTNLGSVTAVSKGGSNTSRTYTFTLTGGSASGTPTLTIAANKIQDVAGNKFATAKTSGSIAVDNTAPTLTVSADTNYTKSKSATITIADSGGSALAAGTYTVRYVWSTSNVTACNETSMPNTVSISVSAGNTSKTGTASISGGTGAGKIYVCSTTAITDRVGNSLAANTISSANNYLDNTAPTISLVSMDSQSLSTYTKTKSYRIRLSDANSGLAAGTYSIKYAYGTTSSGYTCDSSEMTNTISISATAGAATAESATIDITGTQFSRIYVCNVSAVTDRAGNSIAANTTTALVNMVDNVAPTLAVTVTSGTTYAKNRDATIKISDSFSKFAAGTHTIRYVWSTSNVTTCNSTSMPNTATITTTAGASSATVDVNIASGTGAGKLYICNAAAINDQAGNSLAASTIKSADMYLDNIAPTISLSANSDSTYTKTKSITVTLADNNSGLASGASIKYGWSTSTSTAPSSYTTATLSYSAGATSTTFTATGSGLTGSYYLWVVPTTLKDVATNSNTTTLKSTGTFDFDNTAPSSCTWGSWNPDYSGIGTTATIVLTCNDSHSGITMNLTSNDITVDGTGSGSVTNITRGGSASSRTYVITFTGGNVTGTAQLVIAKNKIQDVAGNSYATKLESPPMRIDATAPVVQDIAGGTTLMQTSQTLTLKCSDDDDQVTAYYWGTTAPTSASAITTTTSLYSLESSSGLSKTVAAADAGTYYFACRDSVGNYATKSITLYSYEVHKVLEKIAGTAGTYTSANYEVVASSTLYIAKENTPMTITTLYGSAPTGASASTYLGHTIYEPSTTARTLATTTAPAFVGNTSFYIWFNRLTYTITVTKPSKGSIKVETVTKTGNSITVTSSSSTNTLTAKYGDKVKGTATANSGYSFTGWTGGYLSGTTNPSTGAAISANKTIGGSFEDVEAPTVQNITGGGTLKATSQTVTLKCTDNIAVTAYYWGKTEPTSASSITTTSNLASLSSGLNAQANSAGTWYFACRDDAGKFAVKSIVINSYRVINMLQNATGTNAYTTNIYTQVSDNTYLAKNGTTLTLASIYTVPTGSRSGRFAGVSSGEPSTTAATLSSDAPTLNGNSVYTMWFTRNIIYFKYKTNNGILASQTHSAGSTTMVTWATDGNGYVTRNGTNNFTSYRYGVSSIDLYNYNNRDGLFIYKNGYVASSGAEWICESGCTTSNMTISHSAVTLTTPSGGSVPTDSICNASSADCTVVVKVNWSKRNYTISYTLNSGAVATANPTSYAIDSSAITLNNPTRTGHTFTGWTEQMTGLVWWAGFINMDSGLPETSSTYADSYFTDMIRLKAGVTYTLSGYGDYTTDGFRWRVYDLDGTYSGSKSSTGSYTPTSDCYVRILFFQASTSAQRTGTIISSNAGTTATIPTGTTANRTYIANWSANNVTVTYNHNIFTALSKTAAGVTVTYDHGNQYLTLNGTYSSTSLDLGRIFSYSFTSGATYQVRLKYVSGSYTTTVTPVFVFDLQENNANFSTRSPGVHYVDTLFPTSSSGDTIGELTISSSVSTANSLYYWIYQGTANETTFNNYQIQVLITKVESNTTTYGSTYSLPTTPTIGGWNLDGWYTELSGGTKVTSSTQISTAQDHTLYAHWSDTTVPTCTWGGWTSSSIGYGSTTTNTITCTDNGSGIPATYASLTSSAFSVSNSNISILNVTSASLANGYAYTVTVSGDAVGTATVSLKASQVIDSSNNANAAVASGSLTITKVPAIAPILTGWTGTYDGNSHTVTVSGGSGGTINYSTDGINWSTTKPSTVGSNSTNTVVTVYAYVQGDSSHTDSEVVSANITINVPARTYTMYFNQNTATSISATSKSCTIPAGDTTSGCTITTPTITRANYSICGWGNSTVPTSIVGVNTAITLSASNNGTTLYAITGLKADNFGGALAVSSGVGLWNITSFIGSSEGTKYMYRGADPNNYIAFNCTDEATHDDCTIWRILSIEQTSTSNATKVIEIVNTTPTVKNIWNSSTGVYWAGSAMKTAIENYYTNTIKATPKTHIQSASYYNRTLTNSNMGVSDGANGTPKIITTTEVGTQNAYNIGIPRLSDYMLTSTNTGANTKLGDSPSNVATTNNWLKISGAQYFISRRSATLAIIQRTDGKIDYGGGNISGTSQSYYGLPVVHLKNDVFLIGSGTSTDPFYICPACMSSNTCTLTTSSEYATSKTLTITPSTTNVTYSFDGVNFSSTSQQTVSAAGTYYGYIKDNITGLISSCGLTINSRTEYQHNTCSTCSWCRYCSSGTGPSSDNYCYSGTVNSGMAACIEENHYWYASKCFTSRSSATGNRNCSKCSCETWDTSDEAWYTNSCGASNYSNCKNRASRTTYGP